MSGFNEDDYPIDGAAPLTVAGTDESNGASSETPPGSGTNRLLWIGLPIIAFFTTGILVGIGFLIKPGYAALVPGSVRETEPLILVEGAETFESEGEVLYTTVKLRQDLSWWEYQYLRRDDDAQVVEEEELLGDQTGDELLEENRIMMADSKDIAIAVALNTLGYETISSDGVHIVDVVEGSSADGHLVRGDVVVGLDGEPMTAAIDLVNAIKTRSVGTDVVLSVERDGEVIDLDITLGERGDGTPGAFLGVGPIDRSKIVETAPFEIDIDSGSVGGPSAGLAFTLAVLDSLTEGDLEGGQNVAVTGTISPTGAVGAIGGIKQKIVAVIDSDADVFIVPAAQPESDLEFIRERAGDEVTIYPVWSLDEALEVLGDLGGNVESVTNFERS